MRDYIRHFSNPVRLRILCELMGGERSVSELVEAIGARQSAVSQQLNLLRLAGLVDRDRQGTRSVYRITDPIAAETMEFLMSLADKLVAREATEAGGSRCA